MPKSLDFTWLYAAKIRRHAAQANSFISGTFMLRRTIPRAVTTHLMPPGRALAATSRCVLSLRLKSLRPKRLDHLSDEFFFKFLVNFRPRVFVFARQLIVKFRHIAAAFAVELDRVSPYGAVF